MTTLGPLVAADETLHHQITDTFAQPLSDSQSAGSGGICSSSVSIASLSSHSGDAGSA